MQSIFGKKTPEIPDPNPLLILGDQARFCITKYEEQQRALFKEQLIANEVKLHDVVINAAKKGIRESELFTSYIDEKFFPRELANEWESKHDIQIRCMEGYYNSYRSTVVYVGIGPRK